jgi:2-polyprenyl-3-methyl-5-hydroxy-6-metoxy-1,4-benzoquinol methylase
MTFLKRSTCPICKGKDFNKIFEKSFEDKDTVRFIKTHFSKSFPIKILKDKKFIINECFTCTGLFQENILNKNFTNKLYEKYIIEKDSLIKKNIFTTRNFQVYLNELKFIEKNLNKKPKDIKILEVGAGWGYWAFLAKSCNFKIQAVDISKSRVKYMKRNGLNAHKNLDQIGNTKFDIIYSDQTLEHVSSPNDSIKSFSKLLNKNGCIILKVPSGLFTKRKLNKNYKFTQDELIPFEHINIFTLKSFKFLAKKFSLEVVFPKPTSTLMTMNYFKELLINSVDYFLNKKIVLKKI